MGAVTAPGGVDRFEVERAVSRSALPPPARAILRKLCEHIDRRTGQIHERHSPSLGRIAAGTGYDVSTVCRHLKVLEAAGWVTRHRWPGYSAGHAEGWATHYTIHIPQAERHSPLSQSAADPMAEREPASGRAPDSQSESPRQDSSEADLTGVAREEIEAAGGRAVSAEIAAEAVRLVLAGRTVRNPAAYLRRAIRAEPARFLPTVQPPPFAELKARGIV